MTQTNLFEFAMFCLTENDVQKKCALATQLQEDFQAGKLSLNPMDLPTIDEAGRPDKPELVAPRDVPKRKLGSLQGKAAAIHSFCHIEFNAINLACDAVYRFQDMPEQYYADWIQVAAEEAYHFFLLNERLAGLGFSYGDFPAHNGLWELAQKTAGDLLKRMALVPRVMEARGLDVTPGIQKKFLAAGDQETADILSIILRDEIGHVDAGSRWFRYLCEQRGLEPEQTYLDLLRDYTKGEIRCPLHLDARRQAGFTENELIQLEIMCGKRTAQS